MKMLSTVSCILLLLFFGLPCIVYSASISAPEYETRAVAETPALRLESVPAIQSRTADLKKLVHDRIDRTQEKASSLSSKLLARIVKKSDKPSDYSEPKNGLWKIGRALFVFGILFFVIGAGGWLKDPFAGVDLYVILLLGGVALAVLGIPFLVLGRLVDQKNHTEHL